MRPMRKRREYRLTLAGFEPRILLVDHVNATLAADDAAVLVTLLERPEGVANLHDTAFFEPPGPFKGPRLNKAGRKGPSSAEARKLCKGPTPVNPTNQAKKGGFPPKIASNGCSLWV